MSRSLLAASAVLLALAACGDDDGDGDDRAADPRGTTTTTTIEPLCAVQPGASMETITSGGRERAYLQHVPSSIDGRSAVPLVIDLHGYSEGARLHADRTGLAITADAEGFVLLTPEGLPDDDGHAAWDLSPAGADVALVEDLIDHAVDALCADPDRVFITGHSMGGFLISTLACTSGDRITAVAPMAGMRDVPGCEHGRGEMPVLVVHGLRDDTVPFDGGLAPAAADLLELPVEGPSIADIVAAWAERDGCAPDPHAVREPDRTVTTYDCPGGAHVELHAVDDLDHRWPGENDRIWRFFSRFSLRPSR